MLAEAPEFEEVRHSLEDMAAWYESYVADRRRRGVPVEGSPLPGEQVQTLPTDGGVKFCRNGHPQTPENVYKRKGRSDSCRPCKKAWHDNRRAVALGKAEPKPKRGISSETHCSHGHEYNAENLRVDPSGKRRCHKCASESSRRRRVALKHERQLKTHCNHGHEYTPDNTYTNRNGHRECRVCRHESQLRRRERERNREERAA